jgi:hypothetical protein
MQKQGSRVRLMVATEAVEVSNGFAGYGQSPGELPGRLRIHRSFAQRVKVVRDGSPGALS